MKYQEKISSTSESDRGAEESLWSSKPDGSNGQVTPLLPRLGIDESGSRTLIEHLITVSLVIALIGPSLLLTTALNSLIIFGFVAISYILAGFFGIIMSVRNIPKATSVVPKTSDRHQSGLKKVA